MRKISGFLFLMVFLKSLVISSSGAYAFDRDRLPSQDETDSIFRFHVSIEPISLDPIRFTSNDANYFLSNLMRGLYSYSQVKGLVPEEAEKCEFLSSTKLHCRLRKDIFWSDGSRVAAEDYVRAFRHLLSPQSKSPSVDLLKNLKNAIEVHKGTKPAVSLGVQAPDSSNLFFEFSQPDPEFLFKLTSSLLTPIRSLKFPERESATQTPVNGPYRITAWQPGRRVRLAPNPHYQRGLAARPQVEILFVDDDQTALNLYENKTLTFLRRLPSHYIEKYKGRAGFHQIPMARFDYLGFGPELQSQPDLRAALSYAANYPELKKIYDALGMPGCPSLPKRLLDRDRCVQFDLKKAKAHLAKVPEEIKKRRYKFYFSRMGGDDIKKGAEWFQAQWLKHLDFKVDLEATENGVFLGILQDSPPAIFRKGVGLERPTCLAALETFSKQGAENFLRLNDPRYEALVSRLVTQVNNSEGAQKICGEGIQYLLDRHILVPLGPIHFTILVQPRFVGWSLNEMNQLDLSRLEVKIK